MPGLSNTAPARMSPCIALLAAPCRPRQGQTLEQWCLRLPPQVLMSARSADKEELIKLRQEAVAGPFKAKMQALEKLLVGGGRMCGGSVVALWC